MRFKNKAEFAKAILEHAMWDSNGNKVFFNKDCDAPFRILYCNNAEYTIEGMWGEFNKEWSTTPPLKDKDLVWCWSNKETYERCLRFYDIKNKCTFCGDTGNRDGYGFENFEKFEGEYPEWAKEAQKTLED